MNILELLAAAHNEPNRAVIYQPTNPVSMVYPPKPDHMHAACAAVYVTYVSLLSDEDVADRIMGRLTFCDTTSAVCSRCDMPVHEPVQYSQLYGWTDRATKIVFPNGTPP